MRFYQRFFLGLEGAKKIPSTRIFSKIINLSTAGEKSPAQEFFLKVSNLSTTVETLAQYAHPGKSEKLKVFPPQYGVHTQGTLKKSKLSTPHQKSHTQGNFSKNFKVSIPHHRAHTQGNFLKIFKSLHKGGKPGKNESPQHREFFVKNQSLHHRRPLERPTKNNVVYFVQNYRNIFTWKFSEFWRKFWKTASKIVRFFWMGSPPSFHSKNFSPKVKKIRVRGGGSYFDNLGRFMIQKKITLIL